MMIIEPLAGIGNRMRAMDSAISLSKKIKKSLYLVWLRDSNCNCDFDELFIKPKSIHNIYQISRNNKISRGIVKILKTMLPFYFDYYIDHISLDILKKKEYNFEELINYKNIYISTYERFYSLHPLYQEIAPIEALQKVINSYTEKFGETIGIHIRRSDNEKAIRYSPTSKFIELMQIEVTKNPKINFFLATDSPVEERRLKETFLDRIVTHPKRNIDRQNPQAIKDALIDLFCLSRCKKIIGSYWSSFTETACELSNKDKVIIKQDDIE